MPAEGTGHQASESPRDLSGPSRCPDGGEAMRKVILALSGFLTAVALAGAATLRGTVRDEATGKPVPQARVEPLGAAASASTDEQGSFSVEVPDTGSFTLAISHAGYQVTRLPFTAPPSTALLVVLEPVISVADRIEVT